MTSDSDCSSGEIKLKYSKKTYTANAKKMSLIEKTAVQKTENIDNSLSKILPKKTGSSIVKVENPTPDVDKGKELSIYKNGSLNNDWNKSYENSQTNATSVDTKANKYARTRKNLQQLVKNDSSKQRVIPEAKSVSKAETSSVGVPPLPTTISSGKKTLASNSIMDMLQKWSVNPNLKFQNNYKTTKTIQSQTKLVNFPSKTETSSKRKRQSSGLKQNLPTNVLDSPSNKKIKPCQNSKPKNLLETSNIIMVDTKSNGLSFSKKDDSGNPIPRDVKTRDIKGLKSKGISSMKNETSKSAIKEESKTMENDEPPNNKLSLQFPKSEENNFNCSKPQGNLRSSKVTQKRKNNKMCTSEKSNTIKSEDIYKYAEKKLVSNAGENFVAGNRLEALPTDLANVDVKSENGTKSLVPVHLTPLNNDSNFNQGTIQILQPNNPPAIIVPTPLSTLNNGMYITSLPQPPPQTPTYISVRCDSVINPNLIQIRCDMTPENALKRAVECFGPCSIEVYPSTTSFIQVPISNAITGNAASLSNGANKGNVKLGNVQKFVKNDSFQRVYHNALHNSVENCVRQIGNLFKSSNLQVNHYFRQPTVHRGLLNYFTPTIYSSEYHKENSHFKLDDGFENSPISSLIRKYILFHFEGLLKLCNALPVPPCVEDLVLSADSKFTGNEIFLLSEIFPSGKYLSMKELVLGLTYLGLKIIFNEFRNVYWKKTKT